MNGELLMVGAVGLVQRLLLASVDVVLLVALVWGFLQLYRRCPPRIAAALWLIALIKPLVTLCIGPSVSLLAIPLPWDFGNVERRPSAWVTNSADGPGLARSGRPEIPSRSTVRTVDVAPSILVKNRTRGPAQPGVVPTVAGPPAPRSSHSRVAEGLVAPPAIRYSPRAEPTFPRTGSEKPIAATPPTGPEVDQPIGESAHFFVAHSRWYFGVVAILWMIGLLGGIAVAVARFVVRHRQIALCRAADGLPRQTYDAVLAEMDYRGKPARIVVGDFFESPALVGCWPPVIVLPHWFAAQDDATQLRWALKHEVAHVLHRDHWANLFRHTARLLLFFHPIVHLAARRWGEAAEAACDRALVRGELDVVDYTACLFSIVERLGSERMQTAGLEMSATPTQIERRIGGLLALNSNDFAPLGIRYRWLLLPAALLMLCGFSLAKPPQDETNKPNVDSDAVILPSAIADATAPHETAPHETAPHETAPHETAPHETAPDETAKAESTPEAASSSLDPGTAELLATTLEANRYWFDGPPQGVADYRYTFVHREGKRQQFTVADPQSAGAWVKRGITYTPLVAVLLKALADPQSSAAAVEAVERSDDVIQIRFWSDGSFGSRLGGGVSGFWHGYIYYRLGSGTLRLDAKTHMPIELTSTFRDHERDLETIVTERLSEPVQIDSDHWVPLRVQALRRERAYQDGPIEDEETYRFDWAFRVYEPGLWLFDAEPTVEGTALGYHLEEVVINNVEQPTLRGSSTVTGTIRKSKEQMAEVLERYVEANRAWLLPDLQARRGLIYDYAQEDGYRERVIFDSAGNVLAQLESDRTSSESSSTGRQHLITADGREANGMANEPFLVAHPFDPASTSPFSGSKMLHNLATGWGWECASMRLAREADDFGIRVDRPAGKKTWKLTLRPVRHKPTLHIGTMLGFSSWAYLPSVSFERCEVVIDGESQLPMEERYFREGEDESFCTIRFEDWLQTAEGQAPGKVVGRATYRKRDKRKTATRQQQYLDEVFHFTGTYRVSNSGLFLLDEVVSKFESTGSGSTGRVQLVEATNEDFQALQDALKRLDMTSEFLASIEKAPHGLGTTVPCHWGETVPVWLNGKYAHEATGRGEKGREPPFRTYRGNLGVQDLRPERLANGKVRVAVNVYSSLYYRGYDFDLTLGLVDAGGRTLAEQTATETTKTMARPDQKQIVFEFNGGVVSDNVTAIAVSLRINHQWGSYHGHGLWMTFAESIVKGETAYLPGRRDWGPEQAIGEPAGRRLGGDYRHAWSPRSEDSQEEWLELTYQNGVTAVGVNVYETLHPGAVYKVTCYDAIGKEQTAWEGDDPTPAEVESGRGVSRIRFDSAVETDRIRIYLDSPRVKGWNEIDAVGLIEAATSELPEREHWARDAHASSTFADGPRPESIIYRYDGPHTELKYDDGYRDWMRSLGGGAWQVIRFTRPDNTPYLDAVRLLASGYGSRDGDAKFYILDEKMNVLLDRTSESRIRERGTMKWYLFHVPSIKVPETFHVAFQLNSQQRGGIYVATRQLAEGESGHSFSYTQGQGLKPLEVGGVDYDWMIRAYLATKPNEKAREEEAARRQREAARAEIRSKGREWGPEQATGAPDASDRSTGGDWRSAWASKTRDGQPEWLELTYSEPVKAIGVDIYETFNPGAVHKVTAFDVEGKETIAWEGADPTPVGIASGKGLSQIRFARSVETNRVRIHLDSVTVKGWNEIDAVGLVESEDDVHWAASATASSTYAE